MMSGAWPPPVEGVNGASLEGGDGVFDETGFIERVGVDCHLHVHPVGDGKAGIDRRRRGAPVLVQLEAAGAGEHLFNERVGQGRIALAEEAEIDRQPFGGLQHAAEVPGTGRAGGGVGPLCRAGAAAEHGGDA